MNGTDTKGLRPMRKSLIPVLLAVPLVLGLVSCSSDTEDPSSDPAPTSTVEQQDTPDTSETAATSNSPMPGDGEHEVTLGEENTFGEWTFTITDATATPECEYNEYPGREGAEYLSFAGNVQVSDMVASTEDNPLTSGIRDVVMPDGKTQKTIAMSDCYPETNSLKNWSEITEPGENADFLDSILIPEGAEYLVVSSMGNDWLIPITHEG